MAHEMTSQEKAALVNVGDGAYGQHSQDRIPKGAGPATENGTKMESPIPSMPTHLKTYPTKGCNKG